MKTERHDIPLHQAVAHRLYIEVRHLRTNVYRKMPWGYRRVLSFDTPFKVQRVASPFVGKHDWQRNPDMQMIETLIAIQEIPAREF